MSRLRIRHRTGFTYDGDVTASYNEARMLPASLDHQLVLFSRIAVTPPAVQHHYSDYWGTRVQAFELLEQHRELALTAESLVEVRATSSVPASLGWEALPRAIERSTAFVDQLAATKLTAPPAEVAERARELAASAADATVAAEAICALVHEAVEYRPGATTVSTTAAEAWQHRAGVCQDIAHLALGALRAVGIPARYVSGYLHPVADAALGETVVGESHAWVEWFDGVWRGYDPTNAIPIGERHVVVGRGRDYIDVSPLRGVYAGPSSTLFVTVEITREA